MNKPLTNSQTTFGFISVREVEGLGHCGGLLIVSQIGRPIEFHCSAPIAINRAQRILYGRTYETFLYCEQIGLALIDKAKTKPQLYIANCGPMLSLNTLIDVPAVVLGDEQNAEFFANPSSFGLHCQATSFDLNSQTLWLPGSHLEQPQRLKIVRTLMEAFTKSLPLDEPFERIQKAIEEAHAVAR